MKVRKLLALIFFFARKNLISTKFLQNQTLFWICHFCLLLLQWIKSGWPNKVRLIISRKLVGCQPQKGISVLLPCIALASNQNRVRHWPNSYVLGQHNKQHHQREVVFLGAEENFQSNLRLRSIMLAPLHSVEISGFFCHSDFTWNQFWRI